MNTQTRKQSARAEMVLTCHCAVVSCGQTVRQGETIATATVPDRGDIHAPFAGKIVHVDRYRIRIDREVGEIVSPAILDDLSGSEFRDRLAKMGADLPVVTNTDRLIINAVDAEPTVMSRQCLLIEHDETLKAGIEALTRIYHPKDMNLAIPDGMNHIMDGMETTIISNDYPAGLDPLVVKAVTGEELPDNTIIIGLETVFHVGRIIETRLPVMETMITVKNTGRIVPLGTPVGTIIEQEGDSIQDRDRIVLGGVLRGEAAASPNQGVARDTLAVAIVSNPSPVAVDTACVGCGECVRRCPARLDPAMITSYAEFGQYDQAAAEHVGTCFECGLCGYYCIARRPMLQYIRLAKAELAKTAAQTDEGTQR
ncbi:4Fe-4S dicluster domain-containing protein [Pseudodesulfovibrio sp. JC047]|uniref:4Fe-4S dicluster domain-containing protein n=1 Tax=Pseudodesulfovibrio sp. JC047 TaxID=2683199 RepID=UPI0013D384DC|nr:4Fe-4S dicluster domain-containing protein [Pseudodesulfovibrio sp. JC047]NDV19432.1 4Fe-4S dicluster domain-containing protein [Pseudodesulfovibrio sp. JC047]